MADTSKGRAIIACINSPESVTLAGDVPALDEIAARLKEKGLFGRKLKVPLAFHSSARAQEHPGIQSLRRTTQMG